MDIGLDVAAVVAAAIAIIGTLVFQRIRPDRLSADEQRETIRELRLQVAGLRDLLSQSELEKEVKRLKEQVVSLTVSLQDADAKVKALSDLLSQAQQDFRVTLNQDILRVSLLETQNQNLRQELALLQQERRQ